MADPIPPVPPPPSPVNPPGWGPVGKVRNPWAVIGLSLITLGIYFLYWTYQVFREMKDYSHDGVGGPIGLILGIFVGIVNVFLIPYEVGNIYTKAGKPKRVSGLTGFWQLIPIVGFIVWIIKVQDALNALWESR